MHSHQSGTLRDTPSAPPSLQLTLEVTLVSQVLPLLNQQGLWGPSFWAEGKLGSDRRIGLCPRVVTQGHAADMHHTAETQLRGWLGLCCS